MFRLVRYSLSGAILALSATGALGLDFGSHDALIAAAGGTTGVVLAKASLLL